MNLQRMKGMLGLAVRAGQASFGEDACRKLITGGRCGMVLLDGEASGNTRRKYGELCARSGVQLAILPEGMIAEATGRGNMVAALSKGSFAEQMKACLEPGGRS